MQESSEAPPAAALPRGRIGASTVPRRLAETRESLRLLKECMNRKLTYDRKVTALHARYTLMLQRLEAMQRSPRRPPKGADVGLETEKLTGVSRKSVHDLVREWESAKTKGERLRVLKPSCAGANKSWHPATSDVASVRSLRSLIERKLEEDHREEKGTCAEDIVRQLVEMGALTIDLTLRHERATAVRAMNRYLKRQGFIHGLRKGKFTYQMMAGLKAQRWA